jgi:hypothetical protein
VPGERLVHTRAMHDVTFTSSAVQAWWFNPRDGQARPAGTFANQGQQEFTPPDRGELLDWVLVLDDAASNYPPPGESVRQ